ncbi:hypothetical protein [Nonomuraea sp. GTA35]|uniref:hypothetical protein n=1 Tax=Nonomuraea sp. GTA35 TaxID=1676746 RepID=UPI0035BEFAD4
MLSSKVDLYAAIGRDAGVEQHADLTTIRAALSAVVSAGCDNLTHCTCPDHPLPFAELAANRTGEEN